MRFSHVEHSERKTLWGVRLAFILFDAIIYSLGLYYAVDAALLRMDNVIPITGLLAPLFLFVTYLFISRAIYVILYKAPMYYGLGLDLFSFFILSTGAAIAVTHIPGQGFNSLPFWWHSLLPTISHLASISPVIAAWLLISFAVLSSQIGRRRPLAAVITLPLLFIITVISYILVYGNAFQFHDIAILIVLTLFPLIGAVRGRPRLFARTVIICFAGFFLFWHYMGVQPVVVKPPSPEDGITKIYPSEKTPGFAHSAMITSAVPFFGTSSILISTTNDGIVEYLDPVKNDEYIVAPDPGDYSDVVYDNIYGNIMALDSRGTLYTFDNQAIEFATSATVSNKWCHTPKKLLLSGELLYITCDSRPGLMEFDLKQKVQTGGILLRTSGATDFRTGAWDIALNKRTGHIYVIAGALGPKRNSTVVEVDPVRFKVMQAVGLQDTGKALAIDQDNNRLFVTSMYKNKIYEVLLPEMKEGRALSGVTGAESIIYDRTRKVLYTGGVFSGMFAVVDTITGHTIRKMQICPGIKNISISEEGNTLYTVCRNGIYKIDIPDFINGTGKPKTE